MPSEVKIKNGALQTERLPDGRRMLLREFIIDVDGEQFNVPKETYTDFSTLPALGRLFLLWSKVDIAGVVHDWLYQNGTMKRRHADRIWRILALSGEHRANLFQAWTGWFFLRLGGSCAWDEYRRNKIS